MSVSFSRKRSRVFAAFGLPGVMSSWGFTAVRALAQIADEAVEDVSTDKLAEFKPHYQAKIALLQQENAKAAPGGVARHADAIEAAAQNCKIEVRHTQR